MTPSHASASRKGGGEALTGGVQAWRLSSEITLSGCRPCDVVGKAARGVALSQVASPDPRSQRPSACTQAPCTETGRSQEWPFAYRAGPVGEGIVRTSDMHALGKSDWGIVSMKRANKGAQPDIRANHRRSSWRKGPGPREILYRRP